MTLGLHILGWLAAEVGYVTEAPILDLCQGDKTSEQEGDHAQSWHQRFVRCLF